MRINQMTLTYRKAVEWVQSIEDNDDIDESTLVDVFRTLYEREPCKNDYQLGLWSLCCAAVQSI